MSAAMNTLELPGELTVFTVNNIFRQFSELISQCDSNLIIDCSFLDEVDSCGIQLLLHFINLATNQKKDIKFLKPPECLEEAASLLNVATAFQFIEEELCR